jgi:hypothetical protein
MVYKKVSNNFDNAKIYCLSSPHTELIYIGSTCMPLELRLRNHKELYRQFLKGNMNKTTAFKLFELGDVLIEMVEDCSDVCCKKALLKRERFWIENKNCVNKNIPARTLRESQVAYYTSHIEKIKQYYLDNREKKIEYAKQYINNNKEKQIGYMKTYRDKKKKEAEVNINI